MNGAVRILVRALMTTTLLGPLTGHALSQPGLDFLGDGADVYLRVNEATGAVDIMDGSSRWLKAFSLPKNESLDRPLKPECLSIEKSWPQYVVPGVAVVFISPIEIRRTMQIQGDIEPVDCRYYVRPYRQVRQPPFIYYFYPRRG